MQGDLRGSHAKRLGKRPQRGGRRRPIDRAGRHRNHERAIM